MLRTASRAASCKYEADPLMTRQAANDATIATRPIASPAPSKLRRPKLPQRSMMKALVRIAVVVALGLALSRCWAHISTPARVFDPHDAETSAWRNPPEGTVNMLLPNGQPLTLEKGSMNFELQQFLGSKQAAPRAFDFDQLYFTYGSAELLVDSEDGLRDLAAILMSYPRARVKIVGYTGGEKPINDGDLGGQRASAIVNALTAAGIPKARMSAESGGDPSLVDETSSLEDRFDDGYGQLIVMDK